MHPYILGDGSRWWNTDDTKVDAEFGKRVKVLGPSNTHRRGFVSSAAAGGSGKHVTCVIEI